MDQETNGQYVTHVFEDGQILTADDMNNIIAGIDENAKKIEDLDELNTDITNIENNIDSMNQTLLGLSNRVPVTPSENGVYWLAAEQPSNVYEWVRQAPISIYNDPNDDGNIIISNEVVTLE